MVLAHEVAVEIPLVHASSLSLENLTINVSQLLLSVSSGLSIFSDTLN